MTQQQVIAALVAHLTEALGEYNGLTVTYSLEDAVARYNTEAPWVLVTLQRHEPNRWQGEDRWALVVQCSYSLQPGAGTSTTSATDADMELVASLGAAVNGDAGFARLMGAGLFDPELTAQAEDQQSEAAINPHVFTCSTF